MNRYNPVAQLYLARMREFYREPEVIFWVYIFPLLMALVLGIAFMGRKPEAPAVDVQAVPGEAAEALAAHLQTQNFDVAVHDEATCRQRLRVGKTVLFVVPTADGYTYVYDETRPESAQARTHVDDVLLRWKLGSAVTWRTEDDLVSEPGSRYIDFLVPGLMGLNLLGGGLWGVGFAIVDMRVRKLLKRFLATPMRPRDFLTALVTSRLTLMVPEMGLVLLFGVLAFGVPVRGSLMLVGLILLLGAIVFSGIGLALACRTEKTETIAGLINLVSLPMWLVSGTFFSSKRFPEVMQPFIQALPLTQVNDALREVILEGASLRMVAWRLGILAAWGAVTFAVALRWFRWR